MSQYPAVVELSALDGTTGFRLSGEAAGDAGGFSVADAGDVNGDGFDDLIIGAKGADPSGGDSGASYVVFGAASGFAATLELSALDGSDGFQISGEAAGDGAGFSVAGAGDVNGDGLDDLIVGANSADPNGAASGASYVVFGAAGGFSATLALSDLNGANGFQINGATAGDAAGFSVAGAGDINGDGLDDLIVGANAADPNGSSSGASYVVFGSAAGFAATLELSGLDGTNGFQISGEAPADLSGRSVARAGDVNGDGFDDLIVGAYGADPNGSASGASYVVFGRASGFTADLNLSTLDGTNGFQISGEAQGDRSGFSVAGAGDVNGDGVADLVIGATFADPNRFNSGTSYVVFGDAGGFAAELDLSSLDGTNGFQINGAAVGEFSGRSVAGAGDINGDGFDDVIIGADLADAGGNESGAGYVVFGRAGGFSATFELSDLDGSDGFQIEGAASGDRAGFSVASAGDVNGDGLADLIVGAYGADPNGSGSGAGYVVFGRKPDASVDRTGTAASQTLVGSDFADTLTGERGRDQLYGNDGADEVAGGRGADTLRGGLGVDDLRAGDGADVFVFASAAESGAAIGTRDRLLGFQSGLDTVDLTALGITDFEAQSQFDLNNANTIVRLDLDGDGAFDDFGLLFTGDRPTVGDFVT